MGYSLWDHKESDTSEVTEHAHTYFQEKQRKMSLNRLILLLGRFVLK